MMLTNNRSAHSHVTIRHDLADCFISEMPLVHMFTSLSVCVLDNSIVPYSQFISLIDDRDGFVWGLNTAG